MPTGPGDTPQRARRWTGRRTVVLVAVVLVLGGVAAVWLALRPEAAAQDSAATTTTVQAATSTFEQSVTTSGTLTPAVQVQAVFAASGTVRSVEVVAGDLVAEGDVLATIDTLQLGAARAQAAADLATAQAALVEAQESDDGSDAAAAAVTARAAAVAVAQQADDDAEAAMTDATLVAPVSGLVTSVGIAAGDVVSATSTGASAGGASSPTGAGGATTSTATTAAVTIVGTDAWTVAVSVGESDVVDIELGDQVEMTSDDLGQTVFGTVTEIGLLPSTTQGAVAYPVTVTVTGSPAGLFDGVAVDVSIITERRTDVLAVPAAALSTDAGGAWVVTLVAEDGSTSEQTVETGETSGQMTEIVSGLAAGDTVSYTVATPGGGSQEQATQDGSGMPGDFPGEGGQGDFGGQGAPGGQGGQSDFGGGQGGPGQGGGR
ncbi:MAG: efflux RND transporter periplasmic adaptor subunit [Cellulomonadaceae bacterium]